MSKFKMSSIEKPSQSHYDESFVDDKFFIDLDDIQNHREWVVLGTINGSVYVSALSESTGVVDTIVLKNAAGKLGEHSARPGSVLSKDVFVKLLANVKVHDFDSRSHTATVTINF